MARGTAPPLDPAKLIDARGTAGLSQAALARTLGIARQRIIGYEHGRERPEIARLAALAAALGVGVGDLVADDALPPGLAGLRTGAGLTLSNGAAALGAALPEGSQAAANRASLSAAERGRMPLSWQDQWAGEQVRTAMAGAYQTADEAVRSAWEATFGPAPAPEQAAVAEIPAHALAHEPHSTPEDRPASAGALTLKRATTDDLPVGLQGEPGRFYLVLGHARLLGWVWREQGAREWACARADETGRLCEVLVVAPRRDRRTRAQAVGLLSERVAHPSPSSAWWPVSEAADTAVTGTPAPATTAPAPKNTKWRPLSQWLWQRLVQVASAGPAGADDAWVGGARWQEHLSRRERSGRTTGRGYVDDRAGGRYWLTEAGRDHIIDHRDDYAQLYPDVRQGRAVREMEPQTLLRDTDPATYSARQVWGTTRTASQAWSIRATVRELAGGTLPAVARGLEGSAATVRWHRDDATGSVRTPRVDEVVEVTSWTSPWRSMPEAAPDLPGARPQAPDGQELPFADPQNQEVGATVCVTVHDTPEDADTFVLTGDHRGRLAPRTRWDGTTGWGLWIADAADQEVPVSVSARQDLDGAVRELIAPLVETAVPEVDITWRSSARRRLRAGEWGTWTLHAGLVPTREDIIVHGRCVGWLQHAPGGAGYTAHTPAGPLRSGPWKKREEAASAVYAALWHPMPAPELDRRALAPRRPRRKRPYGEPELCPHTDAQLARATVRPLGTGGERVYEVDVAGTVLGQVYRVAVAGRGRQWQAHPEGAESPQRSAPTRAEAVAALLARPGPLWADPDLTIVH